LGFLGMAIPTEHGGAGLDNVSYALVVEEVSAACASSGVIMSVNNSLFCDPLYKFGTEWQKREILAPTASGKMLGCFGLTEPTSGSDARTMLTVAEKHGDGGYVLNGSKNFITVGPEAEHVIVFAVTTPHPEKPRHTALLVRRGSPRHTHPPPHQKHGLQAPHPCTTFFANGKRAPRPLPGGEGQSLQNTQGT